MHMFDDTRAVDNADTRGSTRRSGRPAAVTGRVAAAAPLWRRFVACIIDGLLAMAPLAVVVLATHDGVLRSALVALALVAALLIGIGNGIVLVVRSGQSLGRRWFGIQVLDSHRMVPPDVWQVILRNIVGGVGFGIGWHPFGFLPGFMVIVSPWPIICYIPALIDRRWHRGLNDRWAHTVVIDLLKK
jgi:uncharacterized RDD family membrane protein YckC